MSVPRFQGETPYDAVVNHYGLDIEEQGLFDAWLTAAGVRASEASSAAIDEQHRLWRAALDKSRGVGADGPTSPPPSGNGPADRPYWTRSGRHG